MNFYEELQKYFETTPREKVLEDWEKVSEWDGEPSNIITYSNGLSIIKITDDDLSFLNENGYLIYKEQYVSIPNSMKPKIGDFIVQYKDNTPMLLTKEYVETNFM